jgi:Flp pilus assembly protein TadG
MSMPARTRRKGQALVETAIVLPLLLLLVFGIVQFGILFRDYLALTDAVGAGARQAAASRELAGPVGTATARVRPAAADVDPTDRAVAVTSRAPARTSP